MRGVKRAFAIRTRYALQIPVTRVGKDCISIRLPGSAKAKRLMGPLLQKGADFLQLVKQHKKAQQPQTLTAEEYTQAKATLEKLTL